MAFIGNTNTTQAFTPAVDFFSGNASTTAFTLSRPVASVAQVQAVVNNVAQNPSDAFTVSGNTITFTSAPSSGTNNIYVYYTSPITQVIAPSQGTVGLTQLSATGTPSSSTYLRGDNSWSGLSATDITAGTLAKARLPAGSVLQVVNTMNGAVATTTTVIPEDNTIPQNTEGAEFMSLSITPTSASSKLFIQVVCNLSPGSSSQTVIAALFQDSTANALAAVAQGLYDAADPTPLAFNHYMTAGTTSSTTFKVRGGKPSGANPVTFNGITSGGLFGGVMASSITIWEIAA